MAQLVLGPLLRHVEGTEATIWVETDGPCEVSVLGETHRTFCVEGHHYALVEVSGLEAGTATPYEIALDGETVWPEPSSELPASTIRVPVPDEETRVIFGSCRVSLPHEPPWVLHQSEHPDAQGIDALRAFALRLARGEEGLPDCLLMLGDQIYADDLSPDMRKVTEDRGEPDGAPDDELADFDEYCLAYREAWSEPLIRWLLSTVPVAMIFDDHEVHAQWKISAAWQRKLEAKPWYERHISAGLMAYWLYQHVGNLSLTELERHDLLREVRARGRDGDAGEYLRREMADADRQADHSRWSYYRDLGASRLIVIDSRAGRELEPGRRRMINDGEWDWIVEHAKGDYRHVLLASSVPFFLTPGLHHAEATVAALVDGGRRRPGVRRVAEKLREAAVMDHWASFPDSFGRLVGLLERIATGDHGEGTAPQSILMLSGDVHHCYLAEVELTEAEQATSRIWQAVCSAYRKDLAPREKRVMQIGNSGPFEALARRLAWLAGARSQPVSWRLCEEPSYENQVACLTLGEHHANVRVETAAGADWRDPDLRTVFERDLCP